jgi:hypothetical protein
MYLGFAIVGERGWKEKSHCTLLNPRRMRPPPGLGLRRGGQARHAAAADLFVFRVFARVWVSASEAILRVPAVVSFNSSLPEVVGDWATLVDPYNTQKLPQH